MEEIVKQAIEEGVHRDHFKTEILKTMQVKKKYKLRGEAGEKALARDLSKVLEEVDTIWNRLIQ